MKLTLSRIFSDHMVMQRNQDIRITGRYEGTDEIRVSFAGSQASARSDRSGRWIAGFPPLQEGGPFELKVSAGDESLLVIDILVGDVWLCSGQSNMGIPISRVALAFPEVCARAENSAVRIFTVPESYCFKGPGLDLEGGCWQPVTRESAGPLSAVAFFCADFVQKATGVPQGMINSSIGGTPIQSWMSREALKDFPRDMAEADRFSDDTFREELIKSEQERCDRWYGEVHRLDRGLQADPPWSDEAASTDYGVPVQVPGLWHDYPDFSGTGVFWLSRSVVIPDEYAGMPARLWLGRIIEADTVWVNGLQVGSTGYQYPPRVYTVPEDVLRPGTNNIIVRVVVPSGTGGFIPDKPYFLEIGDNKIDVRGTWNARTGVKTEQLPGTLRVVTKPAGPFNAMIAPLCGHAISGVLWYQGETNAEAPEDYEALLDSFIKDWRRRWQRPDLPFHIVQLPNLGDPRGFEPQSSWAVVREAQRRILKKEYTTMSVTIDLGEWNDIHPLNKIDVGQRLAYDMLRLHYRNTSMPGCPHPVEAMRRGTEIIVIFPDHEELCIQDKGTVCIYLVSLDGRADQVEVRTGGNRLVISSVPSGPVSLRYAWADNPSGALIRNSAGLPAGTFRFDFD